MNTTEGFNWHHWFTAYYWMVKRYEFKQRQESVKQVRKLHKYLDDWDSERHGYVRISHDGRLCPVNNKDCDGLYLTQSEVGILLNYIQPQH